MATTQSACKRPKLSLTIKPSNGPNRSRSSRSMAAVDPQSPTAFNTLTNVYVTAIERSTPVTAINTFQQHPHDTQSPRMLSFPQTPLSANTTSPTPIELPFPSIMTSTPPLSAGPTESNEPRRFFFPKADAPRLSLVTNPDEPEPPTPRRRVTISSALARQLNPPYTHPRSLHSILRNSPLPPRTVRTPMSPRCQSLRFQKKATRRVAYHSPLEQTIITNTYTKSHIDLLSEDASPNSPAMPSTCQGTTDMVLDLTLAFTSDETRDGGQTPGPFEDMRRRMAGLVAASPLSPSASGGIRKRKRNKEKMRHWAWTIGQEDEEEEDEGGVSGAIAATRAAEARAASEPPPDVTHFVEMQHRMGHSGDEDSLYG
ncbi:hypothetical protein ACRALDRAFT_1060393 [Sodiomyces alcalophilus JCM 7366]|uniref:uncharacterized protein n=1 Tax=Sodiomyces alcalophilus JCM 7366 TaxID=591952 RepID=UPI0039B68A8A